MHGSDTQISFAGIDNMMRMFYVSQTKMLRQNADL